MGERVAIVDYGSGNLHSAAKAFERAGAERAVTVVVTARAEEVAAADRIVLPGQGAFGECIQGLAAVPGMIEALNEAVITRGRPFFGICVGMQLMAEEGLEHGRHRGLGWIAGSVGPLHPTDPGLKIPHMGWNALSLTREHPLTFGLGPEPHVYFVHSYAVRCAEEASTLALSDYGGPVTAIIGRDTMVGCQFHPEKSQRVGLAMIANFLGWRP